IRLKILIINMSDIVYLVLLKHIEIIFIIIGIMIIPNSITIKPKLIFRIDIVIEHTIFKTNEIKILLYFAFNFKTSTFKKIYIQTRYITNEEKYHPVIYIYDIDNTIKDLLETSSANLLKNSHLNVKLKQTL